MRHHADCESDEGLSVETGTGEILVQEQNSQEDSGEDSNEDTGPGQSGSAEKDFAGAENLAKSG
jgi:hypothetical protein